MSPLKGLSSGSTIDTFQHQGQQNKLTSRILHLATHSVDLAVEPYLSYCLKMAAGQLKHVAVTAR